MKRLNILKVSSQDRNQKRCSQTIGQKKTKLSMEVKKDPIASNLIVKELTWIGSVKYQSWLKQWDMQRKFRS